LVKRGLLSDDEAARDAITSGRVLVNGAPANNVSRQVAKGDAVIVTPATSPFVSRGGFKLDGALTLLEVSTEDRVCIDAGSATGGFTDCLLQRGAACVVSVDVGYGQLHERLRQNPRVISRERTNIRELDRSDVVAMTEEYGAPDLLVADLSFTSLRPLVPHLLELTGGDGELILLCKPQFEVDRETASKGKGVIRDRQDRQNAIVALCGSIRSAGAAIMGVVNSSILGPAGNAEFVLHVATQGHEPSDLHAQISRSLDAAEELA